MSENISHTVQLLGQSIIQNIDQITANARHHIEISVKEQNLPAIVPVHFIETFIKILGESIEAGEISYPTEELPKVNEKDVIPGYLDTMLMSVSAIKQSLLSYIGEKQHTLSLTASDVLTVTKLTDPLVDHYIHFYTESYLKQKTLLIQSENYQDDASSVPIIKLSSRVAICPIIGEIDERRADLILERTVMESSAKKIRTLILDLSGVATLDTMMTQHLFKIVDSLEVMGVDIIVTGVSSEVAIGVVSLGLDLQSLTIKQNLEGALKSLGMIEG
ncbi:STAS domain-containing protein [Pseudalkalibacillus hwajinpoensis]|uniref:STAS domain-containing protein n=1 Tax=Guptibacillus hwajinpoensis TaxID=208199 RepID=UPI001CFDDBFB|nr:STAS domain-containing protein [Pseudalkalibacillus hwajinpoensis]